MVKRFDNISSPDSVAVMSLKGQLLGYVPRRHIARFVNDTTCGHVYAVSQDAASLWRLTVSLLSLSCVYLVSAFCAGPCLCHSATTELCELNTA